MLATPFIIRDGLDTQIYLQLRDPCFITFNASHLEKADSSTEDSNNLNVTNEFTTNTCMLLMKIINYVKLRYYISRQGNATTKTTNAKPKQIVCNTN